MRRLVRPVDAHAEDVAFHKFHRHPASDDDYDELLTEPTVVTDEDGKPRLVYAPLAIETGSLAAAIGSVPDEGTGIRSGGMRTRSRAFGSRPRYPLKSLEFCGEFSYRRVAPDVYDQLVGLGRILAEVYREWRPDLFDAQIARVHAQVDPAYQMAGPFTSGIVNYENPLDYHRDAGNFSSTWNAMVVFRARVEGGHLVIPGMRLGLAQDDGMVSLFDAQAWTHGVTPVRKLQRDGYRLSVVYYCLKALCACGTPQEELLHARRKRTEREDRRAGIIE